LDLQQTKVLKNISGNGEEISVKLEISAEPAKISADGLKIPLMV